MWIHEVEVHLVISSFAIGAAVGMTLVKVIEKLASDYQKNHKDE